MAKVISFPTRTAADACSSSTTQFHLEIADESPPSNDTKFTCLYDFAFDKDLWNSVGDSSNTRDTRKSDLDDDLETFLCSTVTVPDSSLLDFLEVTNEVNDNKNETSSYAFDSGLSSTSGESANQSLDNTPSLSSLAENHFKCIENGKYKSDSVIDIDDLADLLTSTCIADCKSSKSLESNPVQKAAVPNNSSVSGDISLTDLLAVTEDEPKTVSAGSFGKESSLGDELDDLLGTSKSSNLSDVSLAALAEIHFVNKQSEKSHNSTDINFDSVVSDCSSGSSNKTSEFIDLHSGQKSRNAEFDDSVSLIDILRAVNTNEENISNYINDLNDCVKQKSPFCAIATEVESDDEQTPDIDLNICIKSQSLGYTYNAQLPSPVKEASFDEIDCLLHKGKISSAYVTDPKITSFNNTAAINKEIFERQKETKLNLNQSLFGKALSCKSKPNKSRTEKVSKIRSEMLQQLSMPVKVDSCPQKPEIIRKIVDLSDHCILPSVTGRFVFSLSSCGLQ